MDSNQTQQSAEAHYSQQYAWPYPTQSQYNTASQYPQTSYPQAPYQNSAQQVYGQQYTQQYAGYYYSNQQPTTPSASTYISPPGVESETPPPPGVTTSTIASYSGPYVTTSTSSWQPPPPPTHQYAYTTTSTFNATTSQAYTAYPPTPTAPPAPIYHYTAPPPTTQQTPTPYYTNLPPPLGPPPQPPPPPSSFTTQPNSPPPVSPTQLTSASSASVIEKLAASLDKPAIDNPLASKFNKFSLKPAYTPVKKKSTADPETPPPDVKTQIPEVPKQVPTSDNWPQSLRDYIGRAFANVSKEQKDLLERELKELILTKQKRGEILTTDWDTFPLISDPTYLKGASKRLSKRKKGILDLQTSDEKLDELTRKEKRAKRFAAEELKFNRPLEPSTPIVPTYSSDVIDWDEYTIVGTSTQLEKKYFRLTSAPDPATVRPLSVLKQSLSLLKGKWQGEGNYTYICDQLKSMRQDLTVQRIKNDFTVMVYEIHARIALEKGDLGEYNQCQSQLRQLYAYDLPGNVMEFTAYRILYLLHTRNRAEINATMAELTDEQKADSAIQHALRVRSALATNNYHQFFKLFVDAPNMGGYLMDQFVERERVEALKTMAKAYLKGLPLAFIKEELAFNEYVDLGKFLVENKADFFVDDERTLWDTKLAIKGLNESSLKFSKIDIKGQI